MSHSGAECPEEPFCVLCLKCETMEILTICRDVANAGHMRYISEASFRHILCLLMARI